MATLSTIIVTHDSREAVQRTLPALVGQLRDGDELIVVDNASADGTQAAARELAPDAVVIETGSNLGFGAACNRGAEAATSELLCFLNPDAAPAKGFRDAIELPLVDHRGWAAWQGLVTADRGRTVNTRGGVVHYTGIAWAGGAGEPVDAVAGASEPLARATAAQGDDAREGDEAGEGDGTPARSLDEPGFVSGACLAIPRTAFLDHGGFAEDFFLYHEDVDLSLRVRLAGGRLGVEPRARVDHEYEFSKGAAKWRQLERNRWATLIRTYPAALVLLLAPGLLATELALVVTAATGGWLPQKLAAWADTLGSLPRLLRERSEIQARRTIGVLEFARALTADLDSPYLGATGRSGPLRTLLRGYWSAVVALLGSPGLARSSSGTPFERSSRSS
jgi:N-acetylglucosaminyl-diphospho-decaprenol L-rhamnosyltransferase